MIEEYEQLNEKEIKDQVPTFTSVKLCDLIILYRYLGLYKALYTASMEELAQRRINGDDFDFETYIDDNLKDLPEIKINILPDLSQVLNQVKKMRL